MRELTWGEIMHKLQRSCDTFPSCKNLAPLSSVLRAPFGLQLADQKQTQLVVCKTIQKKHGRPLNSRKTFHIHQIKPCDVQKMALSVYATIKSGCFSLPFWHRSCGWTEVAAFQQAYLHGFLKESLAIYLLAIKHGFAFEGCSEPYVRE